MQTYDNDCDHYVKLTVIPITLRKANEFVEKYHRHLSGARGCRFCIAVVDDSGVIRGVAVIGSPNARMLDDGLTAEMTRVATDGCPNACSMLYMAAWRSCKAQGYRRLITYTLIDEPGTSLRAIKDAGWKLVANTMEGNLWDRWYRPSSNQHPTQTKQRWEITT